MEWTKSLGSNKALEFLNSKSVDFGSTAGAAAFVGRANGNPIRAVYVYSKPEWTALVTRPDTGISGVADLKGKRVAVTRGTDPFIFLLRALDSVGLTEKDIELVPLQHTEGQAALQRGDVQAWSGLDPMMATSELEQGSKLFYRNPEFNSYGVLNVREEFAKRYPAIVKLVIAAYERARADALANPADLQRELAKEARLSDAVASAVLKRTDHEPDRARARGDLRLRAARQAFGPWARAPASEARTVARYAEPLGSAAVNWRNDGTRSSLMRTARPRSLWR